MGIQLNTLYWHKALLPLVHKTGSWYAPKGAHLYTGEFFTYTKLFLAANNGLLGTVTYFCQEFLARIGEAGLKSRGVSFRTHHRSPQQIGEVVHATVLGRLSRVLSCLIL